MTVDEFGTHYNVEDVMRLMLLYHGKAAGEYDVDFSGDGREIASTTTTMMALRVVLLPGHRSSAVTSLWPISILSGNEEYEFLDKATETMRTDLERIQRDGIYVPFPGCAPMEGGDGSQVEPARPPPCNCKITLWLSADLKFVNMVTGMVPSNNSQSCCYCHGGTGEVDHRAECCNHGSRHDPTITWEMDRKADEELGRGRVRKNLFAFIPTERIVVDMLHMFLRISDRLIAEACALALVHEYDNDNPGEEEDGAEAEWLTRTFGVVFGAIAKCEVTIRDGKKGGGWKTSRLNGNKRRLIMTHFEFSDVFKKNKELGAQLQTTWDDFWNLYRLLNQHDPLLAIVNAYREANNETPLSEEDLRSGPDSFSLRDYAATSWTALASGWVNQATMAQPVQPAAGARNGQKRQMRQPPLPITFITPYVHIFVFHVGAILVHVGTLTEFCCQGLELANNIQGRVVPTELQARRRGGSTDSSRLVPQSTKHPCSRQDRLLSTKILLSILHRRTLQCIHGISQASCEIGAMSGFVGVVNEVNGEGGARAFPAEVHCRTAQREQGCCSRCCE